MGEGKERKGEKEGKETLVRLFREKFRGSEINRSAVGDEEFVWAEQIGQAKVNQFDHSILVD